MPSRSMVGAGASIPMIQLIAAQNGQSQTWTGDTGEAAMMGTTMVMPPMANRVFTTGRLKISVARVDPSASVATASTRALLPQATP